jgi:hypothetical protein
VWALSVVCVVFSVGRERGVGWCVPVLRAWYVCVVGWLY